MDSATALQNLHRASKAGWQLEEGYYTHTVATQLKGEALRDELKNELKSRPESSLIDVKDRKIRIPEAIVDPAIDALLNIRRDSSLLEVAL